MEIKALQEQMQKLYCLTLEYEFHKSTYEKKMELLKETYADLLSEIAAVWNQSSEDRGKIIECIPDYAVQEIQKETSKRKREFILLDHKMNMVSWFIPLLGEMPSEASEEITQKIIDRWNEQLPEGKIGHSTYESIRKGFRRGISCYISTAVCRCLGKADDCHELDVLRKYRDGYLMSDAGGEELVREYYNIAPTIVKRIDARDDADSVYSAIWKQYLEPCVALAEQGENEACREKYKEMVKKLESEYLYS